VLYSAEADPLCYPGTNVLINHLDFTDPLELEEAETALFLVRANEPLPPGELDLAHYLSLHRHLFQDVYAWAGEIRTIRIGKGGNWFAYPEHIRGWLEKAFVEYGDPESLIDGAPDVFASRTARLIAEINAAHPFARATAVRS
jgi:cell filamentation protein